MASSASDESRALRATLRGLCVPGVINMAVQPVVRLADLAIVGYEALLRVPIHNPRRSPTWWLESAGEHGLRSRIEIAAWRAIIEHCPPPDGAMLFVNASAGLLAEPDLLDLRPQLPEKLVIEVTEREAVADYMRLRTDLAPWLSSNARLAIDDTGAGYSSLRHVIELSPDFLKIDQSLVSSVDSDRNRRALVRSLVAFAREVGCTVIAEGVETIDELNALRDAEVELVQGFLLECPQRPWGTHALARKARIRAIIDGRGEGEMRRFRSRLEKAADVQSACEAAVEYLYRRGDVMPSIYLERGGQLRCIAQRGLWQVLNGLGENSGITGRTWARGESTFVADVSHSTEYLEAIPDVKSEVCVPIIFEGRSIGALNVESTDSLEHDAQERVEVCAHLLAERFGVVGWGSQVSAWQAAARASVTISELALEDNPVEHALVALCSASGLDSAALIEKNADDLTLICTAGPLAPVLNRLPPSDLGHLAALVDGMTSCYSASDATGRGFVGTNALRAFARAVVVLPLRSGGKRLGTLVLASSTPRALSGSDVEPLELLAAHFAATLSASGLVAELRRQAAEDRLTGLSNRMALEERLDAPPEDEQGPCLVGILDIDHFKLINDERGHLVGDNVLQILATRLREAFPDLELFRYGGDEFALIVNGLPAPQAQELADALCREACAVLSLYGSSMTAGFTMDDRGGRPRTLLAQADETLLWAKRFARGHASFATKARGVA